MRPYLKTHTCTCMCKHIRQQLKVIRRKKRAGVVVVILLTKLFGAPI